MLVIKSIIYRIFRVLLLLIVSYVVLGDISEAISISLIDMMIATAYYYYFDRVWDKYLSPFFKNLYIKIKYRRLDEDSSSSSK